MLAGGTGSGQPGLQAHHLPAFRAHPSGLRVGRRLPGLQYWWQTASKPPADADGHERRLQMGSMPRALPTTAPRPRPDRSPWGKGCYLIKLGMLGSAEVLLTGPAWGWCLCPVLGWLAWESHNVSLWPKMITAHLKGPSKSRCRAGALTFCLQGVGGCLGLIICMPSESRLRPGPQSGVSNALSP